MNKRNSTGHCGIFCLQPPLDISPPRCFEMTAAEKIATIESLDELHGYETEAKKRGLTGDEVKAIHEKRDELTPKKRRRK